MTVENGNPGNGSPGSNLQSTDPDAQSNGPRRLLEGTAEAELVETRSQDLQARLDAHAVAQVDQMIAEGWEVTTAAAAWLSWVGLVAAAAADRAIIELVWKAGAE